VGQNEYALKPETERNKTQEKVTNLNQDLTTSKKRRAEGKPEGSGQRAAKKRP
jgi:hypothetical protein